MLLSTRLWTHATGRASLDPTRAPSQDQCPDETAFAAMVSDACKLTCVGGECHSTNIFGACKCAAQEGVGWSGMEVVRVLWSI